ncbi:hypothetical protein [Pseudomonas sp. Marseille-Q1929]|uniref:hypothetical protein n=1 Tax=Pseudomonas sp. Marseille-Q1929 TaxID=2730402 RepID=UPI001F5E2F0F|nr:hypothetical protein [Pseudomonas sp. Marseille-Q1929]
MSTTAPQQDGILAFQPTLHAKIGGDSFNVVGLTHNQHQTYPSTPEKTITSLQVLFQPVDTLRTLRVKALSDRSLFGLGQVVCRLSPINRAPQLMAQKMVSHQERHQEKSHSRAQPQTGGLPNTTGPHPDYLRITPYQHAQYRTDQQQCGQYNHQPNNPSKLHPKVLLRK